MGKTALSLLASAAIIIMIASQPIYAFKPNVYVAGKYGSLCYLVGNEHGNIKYPIYFNSLDKCEEFITNND